MARSRWLIKKERLSTLKGVPFWHFSWLQPAFISSCRIDPIDSMLGVKALSLFFIRENPLNPRHPRSIFQTPNKVYNQIA